jgi:hypothetical protein
VSTCPTCSRPFHLFRWKYDCSVCRQVQCADCLVAPPSEGLLCPSLRHEMPDSVRLCARCHAQRFAERQARYLRAQQKEGAVETWSANYKGRVPRATNAPGQSLTTDWHRSLDDVYGQLRTSAAFCGYDIVYDIKVERSTGSEGNYNYTVHKATGTATKRS